MNQRRSDLSSPHPGRSAALALQHRLQHAVRCGEQGRYPEALQLLDSLLAEDPDCLTARLHRGKLCVFTGQLEQAAAEFNTILIQDEENLAARLHLAALFILIGLQGDAELHLRLATLCSALQDDPHDPLGPPRRVSGGAPLSRLSQN